MVHIPFDCSRMTAVNRYQLLKKNSYGCNSIKNFNRD